MFRAFLLTAALFACMHSGSALAASSASGDVNATIAYPNGDPVDAGKFVAAAATPATGDGVADASGKGKHHHHHTARKAGGDPASTSHPGTDMRKAGGDPTGATTERKAGGDSKGSIVPGPPVRDTGTDDAGMGADVGIGGGSAGGGGDR